MKVFINGTNNANKGAELMFCAICQQLEKRYPGCEVIIPSYMESPYPSTKLVFRHRRFYKIIDLLAKYKIAGILRKLHLPYVFFLRNGIAPRDMDVIFLAHGYGYGDVWQKDADTGRIQRDYLKKLHNNGTKSIFLPQAFGPFTNPGSIATGKAILDYADMICAREETSYEHLKGLGGDISNVCIYPDFTANVEGTKGINILRDAIVLIPNRRMITEAGVTVEDYCHLFEIMISWADKNGKDVVLFNHEASGDLALCNEINAYFGGKYKVFSGLSALDTKGALSMAYAVVSSRFHGVANCLSSNVPVVATSWNNKYEMLFKDYGLEDMIIDLKEPDSINRILPRVLDLKKNSSMRAYINEKNKLYREKINEMWDQVFKLCEK